MLDNPNPDTRKQHFDDSVRALVRVTRKAQLIRKLERRSQDSENASAEEMAQILADLKKYREQLRQLDQPC